MKLKAIPRRLGYILGAQWTRDLAWAVFTISLARHSPEIMGQIVLALTFGYLVKTFTDVGLNDFLLSVFARGEGRPRALLGEVTWLKLAVLVLALGLAWLVTGWQNYSPELRLIVLCIAAGLGLDAVSDSFFALCQARGRQDVEMRIRIPSALLGIGFGIVCVWLDAPPLCIALYKPLESLCCMAFALVALGRNPLAGVGRSGMADLVRQMKSGLVFTCMAACAMFYNKVNVIFLKEYGSDADVGGYGVAWEMVEGLSVLISSALLAGQTARSLWAAALPVIFLLCVESDRLLPLIYGDKYTGAVTAQRLLTPCLATAFLHNLAAYAMIGMRRHRLLLGFYASGLVCNIVCCMTLIPRMPLEGAALALTVTKVWVAVLTVGFFQWAARPMTVGQWLLMLGAVAASVALWQGAGLYVGREVAELAGLVPLLALLWHWRPPPPFEAAAGPQ